MSTSSHKSSNTCDFFSSIYNIVLTGGCSTNIRLHLKYSIYTFGRYILKSILIEDKGSIPVIIYDNINLLAHITFMINNHCFINTIPIG